MILGIPREILDKEKRVAALPEMVAEYVEMGFDVLVQASAGRGALRSDKEYVSAGADVIEDAPTLFSESHLILKVKQPCFNEQSGRHEVEMMREEANLIAFLHPAAPANHEMVIMLRDKNITSFTMDGIPRTPRAQRMDALTSMSTVSGYKAVLMAANHFPKFIPKIGTGIGTLRPARVLVVGAGVVGLQAIATAKRLGGIVTAFDIREDARKAAESLGARAAAFDVPSELAIGEGGYASALPVDWLEREMKALRPLVAETDILILSVLIPGEVAPVLITEEMVATMKAGSVIVDVSIDQGGNCAVSEAGREIDRHGVVVCALLNIPGSVPVHASWLYGNNVLNYVKNLFKEGVGTLDMDDDIVRHSLVTHRRQIVHKGALKAISQASGTVEADAEKAEGCSKSC